MGGRTPACPPLEVVAVGEWRGLTDNPECLAFALQMEDELTAASSRIHCKKLGVCCNWV